MKFIFILLSVLVPTLSLQGQLIREDYLDRNTSGLRDVIDIANMGDNRLFFVEQDGDVKVHTIGTSTVNSTLFLDLSVRFSGEQGLLGLAFHPNYASNGYFFVNYIPSGGSRRTRISRFSVSSSDPDRANSSSEVIIMEFDQPFSNHNGGDLDFDDAGNLYIASGDGGDGGDPEEYALDLTSPLGKILRIRPSTSSSASDFNAHTVPNGNPYSNASGDTIKEIWHHGLRNPWRIHIDPNDNMWIADVGQRRREEVNFVSNDDPLNFGWDCLEGTDTFETPSCVTAAGYTDPVLEYVRSGTDPSGTSITGGVVLTGASYPNFEGHYLFGDYGNSRVWTLSGVSASSRSQMTVTRITPNVPSVSTFGLDHNGIAYAASLDGDIFRYLDSQLPIALISTEIERVDDKVRIQWKTSSEINASHFELERRTGESQFEQIGVIPARGNPSETSTTDYVFDDDVRKAAQYYYRLKAVDLDGSYTYSVVLQIDIDPLESLLISPNPTRGDFQVHVPAGTEQGKITIVDVSGKILFERTVQPGSLLTLNSAQYGTGVKFVTYASTSASFTKRLVINR